MLSYTFPMNGMRSALLPLERTLEQARARSAPPAQLAPRADVVETADGVVIRLAMPGASASTIDVQLEKDVLAISAVRETPGSDEGALFHHCELTYGTLARRIRIPIEVDRDSISASYVDGVLTVTLPRAETSKPRKIEVKAP